MSRGRLSFAPEVCVKGTRLLDLIGGNTLRVSPAEAPPEEARRRTCETRLDRWASETARRILDLCERDPEVSGFLVNDEARS